MRHSMQCAAMLFAFALGAPSAVVQSVDAGANTARFQYDELTLMVPAGRSPPGPDDFELRYAQALEHFATSASLASLQADAGAKRDAALKALNEPGAGERVVGMLTGKINNLVSRANPVAGMLFGMLMGAARKGGGSDAADREHAAHEAEVKYREEASWRPKSRRISIWDHWLRVDDLDDGSVVIYKPDVGEYLVLDTHRKTWIRLNAAPVDGDAQRIAADPHRCEYASHRDTTSIGSRTLDGRVVTGYRSVERLPFGQGGLTMVSEDTSWISGQRIPGDILEVMHGFPDCPPDSPAARSETVPDDRVVPYQSVLAHYEDGQGRVVPGVAGTENAPDMIYYEQHLRTLDERDREALFSAPPDYRRLQ